MLNRILFKKIKSPLLLRGAFPYVIARERSDRSNLNNSGFSLIELMVAVAILAMAIFGIFHACSVDFMGMNDARERTVATNYAQEAMEDIKNMDFEKIITTSKTFVNSNKQYRVDVIVPPMEMENLKEVTTVVNWKNRNGIQKTVTTSMSVNFTEVFASDPAKIVLFTNSYSILNSPTDSEYAATELTAVIKDINGNTIIDWGEKPGEGNITFSITSTDIFGTLSEIQVTPVEGRAKTTFTSNGTMLGNFGLNEIVASVYLPDAGTTVTDTTTIKITNGPVKIILDADPKIIKASTTNSSTITVSSSPDSFSYVPADGVEVEFYEETTLTLVDDTVQYDSANKVVTFNVEVTGENIEIDAMKISWSDSHQSEKVYKIDIDDIEVWSGNIKSSDEANIINTTIYSGEINISNIRITFGQDMAGKFPIVVTFFPPVSGLYEINLEDEPPSP